MPRHLLYFFIILLNTTYLQSQPVQTLDWFSYFGGPGFDHLIGGSLSSTDGHLYVFGHTQSLTGIAFGDVHQSSHQGTFVSGYGNLENSYLSKWSTSGDLLWSTYFGGSERTFIEAINFLSDGKIVAVGYTFSEDGIATPGAYQELMGNGQEAFRNAFIAVFTPQGSLEWASYFGNNLITEALDVVVDVENNIYVGGSSTSIGLATPEAFQTERPSEVFSGFIAKFSAGGQLIWCTYYGTESTDRIRKMATDGANHILISGTTLSTDGLASEGADLMNGTDQSLFMAKFTSEGELLWGTYLSGENTEWSVNGLHTDSENNIYFSGVTRSGSGIATPGSYITETPVFGPNHATTGFICKYDSEGNKLWGTYLYQPGLSAQGTVYPGFVTSVRDEHIYAVLSASEGVNHNVPPNAFQSANNGPWDLYVQVFNLEGFPVSATVFGGNEIESFGKVVPFETGQYALLGNTVSTEFYGNELSWQGEKSGSFDGFLALITDGYVLNTDHELIKPGSIAALYPNPSSETLTLSISRNGEAIDVRVASFFDLSGRLVLELQQPKGAFAHGLDSGLYIVKLEGTDGTRAASKLVVQ